MKKYIICALILITIFVIGCNKEKPIGGERDEHGCLPTAGYTWCESKQKCLRTWEEECPKPATVKECITDDDCVTGGCSGTICQSKDAEPIFTTCEFLPEYACYKKINCKCIDNKCQWGETEEFNKCVEEARKAPMPSEG